MSGSEATPRRRRAWRIALWAAAVVLLLPLLLLTLVLLAANVGPGQRLIERQVASLTGGTVVLRGLSGRFPDALRLAHAEIRDARGTWLTLDGIVLDWSPTRLLRRVASIDMLTAAHVGVSRLPEPSAPVPPAKPSQGFSLPVTVDLRALHVARLNLAASVAGRQASVTIDGSGRFKSLDDAGASVAIDRIDGQGRYRLGGKIDAAAIEAALSAEEPQGGLVSGLAKLPALGALSVHGTIAGPRRAERADLAVSAGKLQAAAHGTIDLVGNAAWLDVAVTAPAMAPRPDLAWSGITLRGHVHGPFSRPELSAHADLTDLKGGGAGIDRLTLEASGDRGSVDAHAVLTGLVLPPPKPDLFAAAPLDLTIHADLDRPNLPIRFALRHSLVTADGHAQGRGDIAATIHTVVPDLAPLAAIGKVDLQGSTEATASFAVRGQSTDLMVDGTAHFTGGQAPVPALLGETRYGATASLVGQNITVSRAVVDSGKLHASITGSDTPNALALTWRLVLNDLAAASPTLLGALQANGHVDGPPSGLALDADIEGEIGTKQVPRGPITVALRAQGVPGSPAGTLTAQGRLAGAPLSLEATAQRDAAGGLHAVLKHAAWKSLTVEADVSLPKGATLPIGRVVARMSRLADLSALTGQAIGGSVSAVLETTSQDARIDIKARDVAASGSAVSLLSVAGHVRDPMGRREAALVLDARGIASGGVSGTAHLTADGPQTALLLTTRAGLMVRDQPAAFNATARLDASRKQVVLQALAGDYRGESLRLRAPARVDFGATTGVDRLALGLNQASIEVAGRIAPTLALTAAIRGVTPELAKPFAPGLNAEGLVTADARLTGTTALPQGSVRVRASGMRLRTGPAASLPLASLLATIDLRGSMARLDARLDAGPKLRLAANGTAPLQPGGSLALRATGTTDLRLLDPILNASGQRAAGNLALDATITGSTAAPRLAGTFTLDRGEVQDFVQGLRVTDITARLVAAGDTVRIARFDARAGGGSLSASGSVGVLAPGIPVDLRLKADRAKPLASDLLTATLDADLTVRGQAQGDMLASGRIFVRRADINIPNGLPPSVAVLHVRRLGDKPPARPSTAPAVIRLALEVDAPNGIFVRGHGLDSELGGKLRVGGTSSAPQIDGGFQMRRGSISVAGTNLNFSKGEVGFNGTGVTNRIDPTLDFVADSISGNVTATLTVGGYADAPKITLSSVPDLPQDEVLAHLLFGVSIKDLSAVQIAEIAAALAELSGVTGGSGDPLGAVRKGLGLDRLSVGGGSGGSSTGATVEAGRYVARGVYVGAKQATSGGGTAAIVQVDITKHLKAQAQLATGGGSVQGATPENDPGSTVGLSYQFDY